MSKAKVKVSGTILTSLVAHSIGIAPILRIDTEASTETDPTRRTDNPIRPTITITARIDPKARSAKAKKGKGKRSFSRGRSYSNPPFRRSYSPKGRGRFFSKPSFRPKGKGKGNGSKGYGKGKGKHGNYQAFSTAANDGQHDQVNQVNSSLTFDCGILYDQCFAVKNAYGEYTFRTRSNINAIVDTACTSPVTSEKWLNEYEELGRELGLFQTVRKWQSNRRFTFANGQSQSAHYSAEIALYIGQQPTFIVVHVFRNTNIELLLSLSDIQNLGLSLDFSSNTVSSRKLNFYGCPLEFTSSGHPSIPVFWEPSHVWSSIENGFDMSPKEERQEIHQVMQLFDNANLDDVLMNEPYNPYPTSTYSMEDSINAVHSRTRHYSIHNEVTLLRIHAQLGHCSPERLYHVIKAAHPDDCPTHQRVCEVLKRCDVCSAIRKKPVYSKVGGHTAKEPNDLVFIDLIFPKLGHKDYIIAHMIDCSTRMSLAQIIPDKRPESVIALLNKWTLFTGSAPKRLFADNGGEFNNKLFLEWCSLHGTVMRTTAAYTPHSNGICEKRGGIIKFVFERTSHEANLRRWKISPEAILDQSVRGINAQPGRRNYSPYHAFFGKPVQFPLLSINYEHPGANVTDSTTLTDSVRNLLNLQKTIQTIIHSEDCQRIIETALKKRLLHNYTFDVGDKVYFRKENNWLGPYTVVTKIGDKKYSLMQGNSKVDVHGGTMLPASEFEPANWLGFKENAENPPVFTDPDLTPRFPDIRRRMHVAKFRSLYGPTRSQPRVYEQPARTPSPVRAPRPASPRSHRSHSTPADRRFSIFTPPSQAQPSARRTPHFARESYQTPGTATSIPSVGRTSPTVIRPTSLDQTRRIPETSTPVHQPASSSSQDIPDFDLSRTQVLDDDATQQRQAVPPRSIFEESPIVEPSPPKRTSIFTDREWNLPFLHGLRDSAISDDDDAQIPSPPSQPDSSKLVTPAELENRENPEVNLVMSTRHVHFTIKPRTP